MKENYVDFHCHSKYSDGVQDTCELIKEIRNAGVQTMAITDHNYIHSDLDIYRQQFPDMNIVNGCEVSTIYETTTGEKIEVHIIALDFDGDKLKPFINSDQVGIHEYFQALRDKLKHNCNIEIPCYEEFSNMYPSKHIGRMSIADYLVKHKYFKTIDEAFNETVGSFGTRKAFVNALDYLNYGTVGQAVGNILNAGGIPVLAHVFSYNISVTECIKLVEHFSNHLGKNAGGIEIYYKSYSELQKIMAKDIADKYELLYSSASDHHGRNPYVLEEDFTTTQERHVYNYIKSRK